MFLITQPKFRHGEAHSGSDFVVRTENWDGEADSVVGAFLAVDGKTLATNAVIFLGKFAGISDGVVGETVDFEAAEQFFTPGGGLEGCASVRGRGHSAGQPNPAQQLHWRTGRETE